MIRWSEPNIKKEDIEYVKNVLNSDWYTMGEQVKLLEEKMSKITQRKYAVAINNGTSAISIALRMLNVGIGDEVIVPALSYVATATAVSLLGAKPVFADINTSITIDPQEIDRLVTSKTKAIMCVDFGGSPCNHTLIKEKGEEHQIPVLVDGAQSFGSFHNKKPCLSYGDISITSFHVAKQITTIEGGMLFTEDKDIYEKLKSFRNQGEGNIKYVHDSFGANYRMTDILASFAIKQLDRYITTLAERKLLVKTYENNLKNVVDFLNLDNTGYFAFFIFSEYRDKIAKYLLNNNVETRHYPKTIPQQPIYNIKRSYPEAEWFCKTALLLPVYNKLKINDIIYICDKIKEVKKTCLQN